MYSPPEFAVFDFRFWDVDALYWEHRWWSYMIPVWDIRYLPYCTVSCNWP